MSEQDFNPTPEKPILFSTEMVRAIMNGTKTQTRRVVNPQIEGEQLYMDRDCIATYFEGIEVKPPFGPPGTLLWVRETWATSKALNHVKPSKIQPGFGCEYKAGGTSLRGDFLCDRGNWRPSIFMPKHAARIWLRVTDVRIERLQDMGDDDAIAEGVEEIHPAPFLIRWKDYADPMGELFTEPIDSFRSLWQSINAKRGYGWQKNPWVWVYTFEVLSTNGKPETWPGKQLNVVEEAAKYRHPAKQ